MKIEKFEDILFWQKSRKLTTTVYNIFKETKDFGFKNQTKNVAKLIIQKYSRLDYFFNRSYLIDNED